MKNKDFDKLIAKYLAGRCTPAERALVEQAYLESYQSPISSAKVDDVPERRQVVWAKLRNRSPVKRIRSWAIPYAAAVLVMIAGTWMLVGDSIINHRSTIVNEVDIAPGGNRATLILADGRSIQLDEAQSGIIVGEGISYLDGRQVVVDIKGKMENGEFNSITTPKGGTYQVTLPDGTKVWLNAGTTLRYPSRFLEDERIVSLEGEAYFEVEKLKKEKTPFKVITNNQVVEVLGTEFNITAYSDERETKTTLVEGAVRLSPFEGDKGTAINLKPGEQGITVGKQLTKTKVDINQYTAWKNGLFDFTDQSLEVVMRQLSRWYDIEVIYKGEIPQMEFFGKIYRDKNLSEVLKLLKSAQINFRVEEGRKLLIYN